MAERGPWEDFAAPATTARGPWEDFNPKGAPSVAPPPSVEDLRAQKYGTVSPAELRAQHQANYEYENPNLLQSASRMAEGFTQGVGNLVSGIGSLGKQVYDIAKAPAASMQNFTNTQNPGPMARLGNTLAGMGPADAIAGAGTQAGKYIYGTPEEAGEVIGENAPALAAPELTRAALKPVVGAATVMQKFTPSARAATFSQRATNQLVAGLQPKTLKVPNALKSGAADIHNYIDTAGKGKMWKDARGFSDVANAAADDFYKKNYQPLADDIAKVDPTVAADLERRSTINKTLGRLGYFDKSPLARAMAKTSPQVGALVDELDALKSSLNQRFDAMAPTNAGAAKILRRFSDLKEVADRAATQADRIDLAKMINAGEEGTAMENLMGWAKDAGVTAATLGAKPALFSRWWNILKNDASKTPLHELDSTFARAAQNWQKGSRAFKGAHQPIVRVPRVPNVQGELPFVPGEVGTAATSQQGAPVAAFPNELTQQFNQPLNTPGPGQQPLAFVPEGLTPAATAPKFNPEQSTIAQPNPLTVQFNQPPQLQMGQQQLPFAPTLASTPETVGGLGQTFPPYQPTGPVQIINGVPYERVQGGLRQLPANFRQPAPTISPVPTPAPISGGSARVPAAPGAPVVGSPPMTEEEFVNAMSQPDVNIVPRSEMERRVLDRIASGYSGPERRAVEVPEEFKGKITDYNRRKKSAALYRRQYEKPPR